ncbi:MAG TPA: NAD(+) diphosphatase [Stellaceae bacterium]|nr:NAD(+) diphosphatase [Stellaceae bacterium]
MIDANVYAGGGLDRAGPKRKDQAWVEQILARPETRFVATWKGQNLVRKDAEGAPRAAFLTGAELAWDGTEPVLLGLDDGRAVFLVDLSQDAAPLAAATAGSAVEFTDLRRVGPLMNRADGALLAYARGIAYWHSRHRHCGVCGTPTRAEEGGHVRRCSDPACGTVHFPRTDPAVIMLVHDGERCLLGRKPEWAKGMHSTLAGFVEPGESLEEAVAREVLEESGIAVGDVRYHSSQPWPFPGSLMLGFHAEARSTEITIDPGELEAAEWFERRWLLDHADDDRLRLPRRDSIARRLVEDWLRR